MKEICWHHFQKLKSTKINSTTIIRSLKKIFHNPRQCHVSDRCYHGTFITLARIVCRHHKMKICNKKKNTNVFSSSLSFFYLFIFLFLWQEGRKSENIQNDSLACDPELGTSRVSKSQPREPALSPCISSDISANVCSCRSGDGTFQSNLNSKRWKKIRIN